MTWRTYSESMNPGPGLPDRQRRRHRPSSRRTTCIRRARSAATPPPSAIRTRCLPLPAGLYKTKHHPGMAYQNVRSAPEFKFSNRTLGGGQWDSALEEQHARTRSRPATTRTSSAPTWQRATSATELRHSRPVRRHARHHGHGHRTAGDARQVTASDCGSVSQQRAGRRRAATSSRAATTTSTTWSRRSRPRRSGRTRRRRSRSC